VVTAPKLRAAVLGATGIVGQRLVGLLADHPWFELAAVAGSERSCGRVYGETLRWLAVEPLPDATAALEVVGVTPPLPVDVAFSALDAGVARDVEPAWAATGVPVVSNASALRMSPGVPLLVPEVNAEHLALLRGAGSRFVVTNPNCAVAGLVMALAPLNCFFGVESVHVTTLQAVSGAGYPGVASLDILANVLPGIAGEEEKLERETTRILGTLNDGAVTPAPFTVSAQTFRVPVPDGHLLSVATRLVQRPSLGEAREAMERFGRTARLDLPSSPAQVLRVFNDDASPQPRLHAGLGGGMTVSVGRLRFSPSGDLRFVVLVHNTMRGAAGAALLNAELLAVRGLLSGGRYAGEGTRRSER
jgi:aspartate-semialdehyde dehydrogenase